MEARYLNTQQTAAYLGVSVAQLEKARSQGRGGPPYVKPPGLRRVLYDRELLDAWMASGLRSNTSQPGPLPTNGHRRTPNPLPVE